MLRYKKLMNLNLNTTRCKYRKMRCGSGLSLHIVPLLLKLAYSRFPLNFSGMNYVDDKGEVGKLRTARGKKTSQILAPKCCWPRANL